MLANARLFILIGVILLCLFRLPLLYPTGLSFAIPFVDLLPTFILFIFLLETARRRELKFSPQEDGIFGIFIISPLLITLTTCIYGRNPNSLRFLSSTSIFLLFPIFLHFLSSKIHLERLLRSCLFWTSICASIYAFLEFIVVKQMHLVDPFQLLKILGITQHPQAIRVVSFLGQGAISSICIVMMIGYISGQLSQISYRLRPETKVRQRYLYKLVAQLVFFSVALCFFDSITNLIAIGIGVGFWLYALKSARKKSAATELRKINKFISYLAIASAVSFALFLLAISGIQERLISYFKRGEIVYAFQHYFPEVSRCNLQSLIGIEGIYNPSAPIKGCTPGEIHALANVFEFGLVSQISWICLIIFSLRNAIALAGSRKDLPFIVCTATLSFTLLHYSGIEIWGNNYLFGILATVLYQQVRYAKNEAHPPKVT